MKLITLLKEIQLKEGKQVGPLYHYTNLSSLFSILNKNYIGGTKEIYLDSEGDNTDPYDLDFWRDPETNEVKYFVSTSRNSRMFRGSKPTNFTLGAKKEIVRIKLDGNELSNKYEVMSFDHPGGELSEEEERILCPKGRKIIKDIGQYIEEVALYTNSISVEDIINFLEYAVPANKVKDTKWNKSHEEWEWSELSGGDYGYYDDDDDDDDEEDEEDDEDDTKKTYDDPLNLIINKYKENEKEIEKILGYKIVFLDKF